MLNLHLFSLIKWCQNLEKHFLMIFPGMLVDRDIDLCIDLQLGTHPMFIPPYCMSPMELRYLMSQIKYLYKRYFSS